MFKGTVKDCKEWKKKNKFFIGSLRFFLGLLVKKLIGSDKILRLFNPKEYFDKEKYNSTINKGADKKDEK